jgi:hypothetical protein
MATTPTPTSIQEYQTGFAPVIAPYAEKLLGQAAASHRYRGNPVPAVHAGSSGAVHAFATAVI